MKSGNLVRDKSFDFALKIVSTYKELIRDQKEYVLSKQLLRSGTSVGANIEEAIGAQSRKDFFMKLTIAYKEAREAMYWIKLMHASQYLSDKKARELLDDVASLCRVIGRIQLTMKERNNP